MLYYDRIDISEGINFTKRNAWFVTIAFLIMGSNFKILYVMVATI